MIAHIVEIGQTISKSGTYTKLYIFNISINLKFWINVGKDKREWERKVRKDELLFFLNYTIGKKDECSIQIMVNFFDSYK
jgi:hypothetical protein